jgi:hypothetical protein
MSDGRGRHHQRLVVQEAAANQAVVGRRIDADDDIKTFLDRIDEPVLGRDPI